ncbi:MAG: carbohydrate kinase [Rhodopirellula sp.]|nr:carbohydrate kinase [Rhodopirellula sp.]
MKNPKIISLGEVLWDLFPEGERFGGAPANFACHAAFLGGEVSMISAVGDDSRGREALNILRSYGIDVTLMQVVPDAATGTVGIELDSNGKPTFTIHEGSAWDQIDWNEKLESRVKDADAVYFGTLGQRSEISRNTIRRLLKAASEIPRVLDINLRRPFFDASMLRESVQLASILKLSDDELATVCEALEIDTSGSPETMIRQIRDQQQLDLVIMTRGAEGALLATPNGLVEQPGIATTVVDTVGAGDSFTAAFLVGMLHGEPHDRNLQNACAVAAAVCSHAGAVPVIHADSVRVPTARSKS